MNQLHKDCNPTQAVYRSLLDAMSHPAKAYPVPCEPWDCMLDAIAETLMDHEVSFAVHPEAPSFWEEQIFQRTKAKVTEWEDADFCFVAGPDSEGEVLNAKRGRPEFPHEGATILYVLNDLPPAQPLSLSGPGLKEKGAPEQNLFTLKEWAALKEIQQDFPLGVDAFVLLNPNQVAALPRSTRIELEDTPCT